MNYDGWVTIGTDLDSKEFDKEIKRLQKESEKLAKEEELLLNKKTKLEVDTSKTINELNKVDKKIELISKKMSTMEENNLPQNLEKNNAYQKMSVECDSLITKSQEYATKLESQKSSLNDINQKIIENATNQENVSGKLEETKAEAMGLHMNFDGIGKSLTGMIRKAAQWTMAIFSVRTAYNGIRQAMSMISSYNDDMNNKLYSIKMTFASALEPVITRIVDLIWKMMSYINYIAKAWFGVDLFAKASANSMKSSAKSAKDMKKSLAGFDEANVLNDNGTTGAMGASGSTFVAPEDVPIPSWIEWIAENKDTILGFLKQLGIIILGLKLAKWLGIIGNIGTISKKLFDVVKSLFSVLKGMSGLQIFVLIAGIALTITGIITSIKGVIAFIKDPSWENFNKILSGLVVTLGGITLAIAAIKGFNPLAKIMLIITGVTVLATTISELTRRFFKNKAEIKSVEQAQKDLKKAQEDLKEATSNLTNATKNYDDALKLAEESSKKLEEAEKKNKISGEELFNQVLDGKLKIQDMTQAQREVFDAYTNNLDAQNKLKDSTEKLEESVVKYKDAQKEEIKQSWEDRIAKAEETKEYDKFRDAVVKAYQDGSLEAGEARTLIERAMAGMDEATAKTFTENIPNDIKQGLNPNRYKSDADNFVGWMGNLFNRVGEVASKAWNTIKGWFSKGINVPVRAEASSSTLKVAQTHNAKGAILYPRLQYHANGGIINQPGRGVPITQHIGGERGAEGIIPLTDSQQMDLLGQSIAKYMTINLTNINQLNGRLISRELTKIKVQQDFASNS